MTTSPQSTAHSDMVAPLTSLTDPCLYTRYLLPVASGVPSELTPSQVAAIAVALAELLPDDVDSSNDCWSLVGRARAVGRAVR